MKKHSRLLRREGENIKFAKFVEEEKLFQIENFTYLFTSLRSWEDSRQKKIEIFPRSLLLLSLEENSIDFRLTQSASSCVRVCLGRWRKTTHDGAHSNNGKFAQLSGRTVVKSRYPTPCYWRGRTNAAADERKRNFLFEYFVLLLSPATFSCLKQRNNFPSNDHNINFHFVT